MEVTDPRYAGPILFNPGGPGNSGVKFLLQYGAEFETIFDPKVPIFIEVKPHYLGDSEKYFDLISFDPRGVNNTIPRPNCISDPLVRQIWNRDMAIIGSGVDDETTFGLNWARINAYGTICSSQSESSVNNPKDIGHAAQYVSSAQVANDMVAIIERHGEWRERETGRLLSTSPLGLMENEVNVALTRNIYRPGKEKLQYWGFSYGTVLGQTFASMFPDKVGRMVLDGNVDADDYTSLLWSKNLQDIDAITKAFSVACFEAGVGKCSMYDKRGSEAIASSIDEMIKRLRWEPRWTISEGREPVIITQTDITSVIFENWYNAYYGFPLIDKLLFSLLDEDYSAFTHQDLKKAWSSSVINPQLNDFDPAAAGLAILCTDGSPNSNMTAKNAQSHIKLIRAQSFFFGENWALMRLSCAGVTIRPKFRFEGPFGATSENLYHPILFVNPELDPVTPLRNAVEAAQDYPGSKVLELQGAMGHCSLSMPSLDAFKIIRQYFNTGNLPVEQLTSVETSVQPWNTELKRPDNVGDKIWDVVGKFAEGFPRSLHS